MPQIHRVVVRANKDKKSAVPFRDSTNHQETPQIFWRSTLWATTELPVNNQIPGDRATDVAAREPTKNGLTFRALEIRPDIKDAREHIAILQDLNKKVKQNTLPPRRTSSATQACIGPIRSTCLPWPTVRFTW